MKPIYEIKRDMMGQHDGLEIWPDKVVIRERLKGSSKEILITAITEVGTNRSVYDMPFTQESLRIVTSNSKHILRRLPKKKAKEAKEAILSVINSPKSTNSISDLEKLAELKDKGVITKEEFELKKKQILGV